MNPFRKKQKPERLYGWQILHETNELTGEKRWTVFAPGWYVAGWVEPAKRLEFDSYEEAFAEYAERAGWSTIRREQPQEPAS